MSQLSKIEWTDATWNPVRDCSRVSEGCRNCYAERQAARFRGDGDPFHGFAYSDKAGPHWTGRVELIPSKLDEPLRWRKPRRIFVNSMSDLFHEKLSVEEIAKVFSVMGGAWWHTYQILTKRPERMAAVLPEVSAIMQSEGRAPLGPVWKHVWLGVSVEDQATAYERIPLLLQCPAAVRFVSYEPALGPVDFAFIPNHGLGEGQRWHDPLRRVAWYATNDESYYDVCNTGVGLDWLIVGGESGPGARPFDVAWARSAVEQCRAAGVACFVKQLGSLPIMSHEHGMALRTAPTVECFGSGRGVGGFCMHRMSLRSRKGGDPSEWPEDLRVREFPEEEPR